MGPSEKRTDDRLDRPGRNISDELVGRRGETSRPPMQNLYRVVAVVLAAAVFIAGGMFGTAAADPAIHRTPSTTASALWTDQRLDNLEQQIDDSTASTAKDIRQLRRNMESALDEAQIEVTDRQRGVLAAFGSIFTLILVLLWLGFILIGTFSLKNP